MLEKRLFASVQKFCSQERLDENESISAVSQNALDAAILPEPICRDLPCPPEIGIVRGL
jgi:hypothetical protein